MTYPPSQNFNGALYRFKSTQDKLPIAWGNYSFIENITEEVAGWLAITIKSEKPLIPMQADDVAPYHYCFLLRKSASEERFLLVSSHSELIEHFINWIGWKSLIVTASIKVHNLVNELTEKPSHYCLGTVQARVDGYGRSLKSIALYGTDLADAQLFRDILPKLVPHQAQLRDVRTGFEVIRVGTQGEIKFYYHRKESLLEVDKALSFLTKQGYLVWDIDTETTT